MVASAIHQKTLARVEPSDDSSSRTKSDTHSCGVSISNESPIVVSRRLGMKPNTCIFGDTMRKVLQFCSDDRERTLLQEASDSFDFPIMEDELGKESSEEILYQAHDLSMKSFLACHATQHRCRADLRSRQLPEKTSTTALNKDIDVVKALQTEKTSLSSLLESEKKNCLEVCKENDELQKKNSELELQLTDLRHLVSAAEDEKKKAECLQKLYDAKGTKLNEL